MEDKIYPVDVFLNYLTRQETMLEIAKKVGANLKVDKIWFMRAYKAAIELFTQSEIDLKKSFSSGLKREDMQSLLGSFINVVAASKKKFDKAKSATGNKMYALNKQGDAQSMSAFSMNETEEWSAEQKEEFINKLYEEGVITRVQLAWIEENPDKGTNQFEPALKMAMDILLDQAPRYNNGPLMPSDLEEIEDLLKEVVLSYELTKSTLRSIGKNKSKDTPGYVDSKPFEKSAIGNVGLNESVDSWTEAKLRKFVKKEFEAHIKKGDYMTKKEVKDMIRKTIVQQYKYLWEKSAFFINQI